MTPILGSRGKRIRSSDHQLYNNYRANLGYMRPCPKKSQKCLSFPAYSSHIIKMRKETKLPWSLLQYMLTLYCTVNVNEKILNCSLGFS